LIDSHLFDVVLLSTAEWDNPFWTNKQHVAVQLAGAGYRVFYIDSLGLRRPSASKQDIKRILRRLFKFFKGVHQSRKNIWVWSPFVVPLQGYSFFRWLNKFFLTLLLKYHLKKMGFKQTILWTYNPLTTQLLYINAFEKIIYHCVDEIKAQPGMYTKLMDRAERELAKQSHLVFTTSPKLTQTRSKYNPNTYYFPNVADYDHFSVACNPDTVIPNDLLKISGPRIGFIGAISEYKLDFDLLRFVARSCPSWSIVLIGGIGEGDPWTDVSALQNIPNIHFLGQRPYAELPCYLKGIDVAILPNKLNEYTEAMFPMKFFEYLAAGKPVVTVDLPALHKYKDIICITRSQRDFIHGIQDALNEDSTKRECRISLAKKNTYKTRMCEMLHFVNALF